MIHLLQQIKVSYTLVHRLSSQASVLGISSEIIMNLHVIKKVKKKRQTVTNQEPSFLELYRICLKEIFCRELKKITSTNSTTNPCVEMVLISIDYL